MSEKLIAKTTPSGYDECGRHPCAQHHERLIRIEIRHEQLIKEFDEHVLKEERKWEEMDKYLSEIRKQLLSNSRLLWMILGGIIVVPTLLTFLYQMDIFKTFGA